MARTRRKPGVGLVKGMASILKGIAAAKTKATGRVWDELHYVESRLTRVAQRRKSSFTAAKRIKAKRRRRRTAAAD